MSHACLEAAPCAKCADRIGRRERGSKPRLGYKSSNVKRVKRGAFKFAHPAAIASAAKQSRAAMTGFSRPWIAASLTLPAMTTERDAEKRAVVFR